MTAWMFEGNGLKLMREFYANYNIVNFPAATPAPRWAAGGARRSSRWPT
jgi:TRAP-type mannitol/chloroaromatic compound transport system substrate-binding protein